MNKRKFNDPSYAEALTYLQCNTVPEEARRIFRGQVSIRELDVMDPDYEPEKLRIFHQDELQNRYTEANKVMTNKTCVGEKFLSITRNRASYKGPSAWYEVLKAGLSDVTQDLFDTQIPGRDLFC